MPNIALGVIDLEEDFVSKKGKLSICGGEEIVEPIKKLVGTAQKYDVPVIFCVLTDNIKQQSLDRSGGKLGNKGIECAVAAVKMAALRHI